jgi:APA family basic amino acid/polyamine antiporter
MTQKPKVFVREATGLVREFGSWDSFAFNFGGIVTVVALSALFASFNFLLGANIMVSLLIFLPILLAYYIADTQLGLAMPRSGSDYVYTSRILHPGLGLMAGWMLVFLLILNPAIFSDLIVANYVPGLLSALGMGAQAAWFGDVVVRFLIDNIIIALCMIVVMIPVRHYAKVQTVFIVVALVGAILVPAALLGIGHGGFVAAMNARSPDLYNGVIAKANSLGFTPYFSWTDTILAIPSLGFFLITNWPCTVGGELKNVKRSLPIGVVGAGLFAWVMFFVTAGLYYWVLGSDFAASVAYLTVNSPADSPFSSNLLTTVIQYVYGWNWVTIFIAFSLICACFIVIAQSIFLSDRHVLAWAFDNVIPNKFASINDKWGTPVFTTIVLWIISEIVLLVLLFQSSAIGLFLNAGVGCAMGYAPALLAATLFARRRKDLFESAPSATRYKIGGAYLITIAGAIGFIGFVAIVIFTVLFPQIGYPVTPFNIGFMMLVYLLGLVVYYGGKSYRKGQGIDIELAFKQIPPE